jgi:hypothetical protein
MDALVLGKEDTPSQPIEMPEPPPAAEHTSESIKLGYRKPPISQTQKNVGLGLIGISVLFCMLLLVFYAWGGLLTGLMLSSPLWGCGILCLTVRKRLGLCCCWLTFIMVSGYFYYATGTSQGAIFNRQFWIYGNVFSQITAVIETVLLVFLYLWTFISFHFIRAPKHLHRRKKQLIFAYIGCVVGYVLYFVLLEVALPHFILNKINLIEWGWVYQLSSFIIYVGKLAWYVVMILCARMLYNEHKAAKTKTE